MVSFDGLHNRDFDCSDIVLSIGRELSATLLGLSQIGLDPSSEELERDTHTHTPNQLSFCLYSSSALGLTMQTGSNLFWSQCHIASSNINRLDWTAFCLLNTVCGMLCATFPFPLKKPILNLNALMSLCSVAFGLELSHTHISIDGASVLWTLPGFQSQVLLVIWIIPFISDFLPHLFSLLWLSCSLSLACPSPPPSLTLCWSRLLNSMLLW